mmetsp:Transcript_4851/g.9908  ORF Transcript_4851/g.9908 Transcript_4851/m.9908 type:complete len:164 (-) Transcript_4851:120-611(-)
MSYNSAGAAATESPLLPQTWSGATTSPLLPQTLSGPRYSGVPRQLLSAKQQREAALRSQQTDYDHIISGDILGNNDRTVVVSIDGQEEQVEINGQLGPGLVQEDGVIRYSSMDNKGKVPSHNLGFTSNGMAKYWKDTSKAEREVLIIQVAKRQKRLKVNLGIC